MRFPALLPFLALMAIGAPASAGNVDYAKSEIAFVSKQMNVPVQGRFKKFTALFLASRSGIGICPR